MSSYETIYQGSDSLFMPKYYKSTDYQMSASEIGLSIDPRTANQLGEVNSKINPGVKHIEVQGVTPGVMESVPEQHLDEIRRLMKLTGVQPSLHGPVVEASGVGEGGWTEENRLGAEKQIESAVLRGHKLDPNGNISVTLHSTAALPELTSTIKKDGKEELSGLYIIDAESGKIAPIKPEKRYFPEEGKFEGKAYEFDAKKEIKKINNDQWTEQLSGINRYAEFGEESLRRVESEIKDEKLLSQIGKLNVEKIKDEKEKQLIVDIQRQLNHGHIYLRDSYRNMKNLFDKAYTNSTPEDRKKLDSFAQWAAPKIKNGFENDVESVHQLREIVEKGLRTLGSMKKTPEIFKPLNEFVIDKSAETFANVAQSTYEKFGSSAPIINIENPPAGGGLSRAEDLKKVVEASREKLVKNLSEKGISSGQAKQIAEKMIGATWDVGHINMLRKKGYSEKDIIKETERIAPFVKHVHLSDNFGLDHTELPMGMGNVPMKEIMQKLGEKGFEGQKIIEAGNWWQFFSEHGGGNPFKPTIEAFDSPIYAMKEGPLWSQSGAYGSYFSGHGPVNPSVHHRIYGAGFEALPMELGGEIPGDRSRFSGSPNQ